jgi:hypothetical protein
MAWRLAKSLGALRTQVNKQWPKRSKVSDGTIGDSAHASRNSDHNPWVKDGKTGVVTGMDITHDPKSGCDAGKLAEALRTSRDPRIKYIISNRRICSGTGTDKPAWMWRPYTGLNAHEKHVHISVRADKKSYDSVAPWDAVSAAVVKLPTKPRLASVIDAPVTLASTEPAEPEPDDTKPHAAPVAAPKTGITEGAKVGIGATILGVLTQVWEMLSGAPETILQAVVGMASKPAFWAFVAVGVCVGIIWYRRAAMKKA